MTMSYGEFDALIQTKLDADTEFHASLESFSDEEKDQAIEARKSELFSAEVKALKEKADKAQKAEELANNYKIRAEKAENAAKEKKHSEGEQPSKKDDDLSSKDLYALMNAKVPEDDVEEVARAAKVLGKPISDALKDPVVKSILSRRAEERETANAQNTSSVRRTTTKVTDDALLSDLAAGKVPTPGSKEAEQLFWARRKKK